MTLGKKDEVEDSWNIDEEEDFHIVLFLYVTAKVIEENLLGQQITNQDCKCKRRRHLSIPSY